MMKTIKILLLLIFAVTVAKAQDKEFALAGEYYQNGEYTKAIEVYDSILNSGSESWELYYNLGNAWFKKEDYAKAILNYEKAKKLNPGNEDINYNLGLANTRIADKIEPEPEFFLKRLWRSFTNIFSEKLWAAATIVLWALVMMFTYIFFTARTGRRKKTSLWLGITMLIMSIVAGQAGYSKYRAVTQHNTAIVMTPTVNVKSSPASESSDLFVLHQGTKVKLLVKIKDWYQIRLANGNKGWIKAADVEKI